MREIDKVFLYNRVMNVMEKTLRDVFEQLNEENDLRFYADKNFHNVANLIADTILYTFKEIDISGYNIECLMTLMMLIYEKMHQSK